MKFYWQDSDICKKITLALKKNEVLITSTDTVPGLLSNITQQGFDNLNKLKGGRQDKPYIILISDMSKLSCFIEISSLSSEISKILSFCWPGPLTAVFNAKTGLPSFLRSENNTVAIRCPNHLGLLAVLQNFDGLFSTSANVSGAVQPASLNEIDHNFVSKADFIVDDKGGDTHVSQSTILDFSHFDKEKKIYLLRKGAFPLSEIKKIINIKIY